MINTRDEIERRITLIWKEILKCESLAKTNRFLEVGGNSLLLLELHREINRHYPNSMDILDFFNLSTISEQSAYLSRRAALQSGKPDMKLPGIVILDDYRLKDERQDSEGITSWTYKLTDNEYEGLIKTSEDEQTSVHHVLLGLFLYSLFQLTKNHSIGISVASELERDYQLLNVDFSIMNNFSDLFILINDGLNSSVPLSSTTDDYNDESSRHNDSMRIIPLYAKGPSLLADEDLFDMILNSDIQDGEINLALHFSHRKLSLGKIEPFFDEYLSLIRQFSFIYDA